MPADIETIIALIRRDRLNTDETSTPGGVPLEGEARGFDAGYRKGWTDRGEALVMRLEKASGK